MPRGRKKTDVAPQDLLNEVLASYRRDRAEIKALELRKRT